MQANDIILRDMKPGEEKDLIGMARKSFIHSPMEQIGISKPKAALVAEVDGKIAGAMFLKTFGAGNGKIGYLDVGFVSQEYRGKGVGRVLYPAATEKLIEQGCEHVAAMVIDDNTASWKSLENQGFSAPSITEYVRVFGFGRAFSMWLQTLFGVACGAQFWINSPTKRRTAAGEMITFLLLNILLFVPRLIQISSEPTLLVNTLLAYPTVLVAGVLFGALGCAIAKNKWHFAFPRGGILISLLLNSIGVVFPMVGRWYLDDPQSTKVCRRAMGVQATIEWAGLLLIFCLGGFLLKDNPYVFQCASLVANLLVFRLIPFSPFGSFGGARVWNWNKAAFAGIAAVTLAIILIVVFL